MTEPSAPTDAAFFHVEKLYLKDLSFENPNSPEQFHTKEEPQVEFSLGSNVVRKSETHYEVVLNVTVTVAAEGRAMFLVEVAYAGLFYMLNLPQDQVNYLLGTECPAILFPYVRQIVSSTVMEGGYRPMVLDPVNFAAIYNQQQREKAAAAGRG